MVKCLIQKSIPVFLVLFFVLKTSLAFAASFAAEVDRTSLYKGETFTLSLTLNDAQQNGSPDFSPLEKDFQILRQQQSSQVNVFNSSLHSSVSWQMVMVPKKAGKLVIPEISVMTAQGVLKSQKLAIEVSADSSPIASRKDRDVYVTGDLSSKSASLNAPLVYTVRLVASKPVSEIAHGDFKVDGAVVEQQGEVKIYDTVQGGKAAKVVELQFLITPLKEGQVKIPSFVFQGMVSSDRSSAKHLLDPFGHQGSNDPFGIFQDLGMLDDIMGQPFTLMTDEIVLNVQGPQATMDPWLPAESLQVSDIIEGEKQAKAGEPLTRRITTVVSGNTGSVLPNLEQQAAPVQDFSVYADKPETGMNVSDNGKAITGWREEVYTLVPKHGGDLALPEIKIPWWDIKNKKVAYAVLPSRTLHVEGPPAVLKPHSEQSAGATSLASPVSVGADSSKSAQVWKSFNHISRFYYVLLGGVAFLLASGLGFVLLKRTKQAQPEVSSQESSDDKQRVRSVGQAVNQNEHVVEVFVKVADIERANDLESLKDLLLKFAQQKVGRGTVLSLKGAAHELGKGLSDPYERSSLNRTIVKIEGALYAGQDVSFEAVKADLVLVLKNFKNLNRDRDEKVTRLGALNPS